MSQFKSPQNVEMLTGILRDLVESKFQVELNRDFSAILTDIMAHVWSGKPDNVPESSCLSDMNKLCIQEAIKYINDNISYFPKRKPRIKIAGSDLKHNQNLFKTSETVIQQNMESETAQVMRALLQTQVAIQNPQIVPDLIKEILAIPHLVELMRYNPVAFQQQVRNPDFLQMIMVRISGRNDPKHRPMNLVESSSDLDPMTPSGRSGPSGMAQESREKEDSDPASEFVKRMGFYKTPDTGSAKTETETKHPQSPAPDDLNRHIPPSEKLVANTLPDLDTIHLIDYDLSLDFRRDLDNVTKNKYQLKFNKFGNVSKIRLTSLLLPENDAVAIEPYIFVKIDEIGGRCYTSNYDNTFGKLILSEKKNGFLYYRPDDETCVQVFSQPTQFQQFTMSFLNYRGNTINIREIPMSKTIRSKSTGQLKFVSQYNHRLSLNEEIEIHIYKKDEIDVYTVTVSEVVDEKSFRVNGNFDLLTEQIKVFKTGTSGTLTFKLYEINWNLLTQRSVINAQMVALSNLVRNQRRLGHSQTEISEYVKSQIK